MRLGMGTGKKNALFRKSAAVNLRAYTHRCKLTAATPLGVPIELPIFSTEGNSMYQSHLRRIYDFAVKALVGWWSLLHLYRALFPR